MKRAVAISLLHNLGELLAIDAHRRTDNQVRSIAKLKSRVRDAYTGRRPETLWWSRDVESHPERRKLLDACTAYKGGDDVLRRINDARRAARQSTGSSTSKTGVA